MKAFITRFSLILILGLTALISKAQTTIVDGVVYEFNATTAMVIGYNDDITNADIKSSVVYNGIEYTVTEICDKAFFQCEGMTKVTIPYTITSIGNYSFARCSNLTEVKIPNSITEIGAGAFRDCSTLPEVTIPNSVTSIGAEAFRDCVNLKSIIVDNNNPYYADVDGILYDKNITYLIQCPCAPRLVTIPNSVVSIGNGAFSKCYIMASVTIPNSVTEIGDEAFCESTILTSVTIPDCVTKIGDKAFCNCFELEYIFVDKNNPYYADIDGVLYDKNISTLIQFPITMREVAIPNSVTEIGSYAFSSCWLLTSITIPNSITKIGKYAFSDCISLSSITIPNSITKIEAYAFAGCRSLTEVTIPTSVNEIDNGTFFRCNELTLVTIPNSVNSIGSSAFSGCNKLTELKIPNSVLKIGDGAFSYCSDLNKVIIPNSVTSISNMAFYSCISMTSLTIPKYVTSIGDMAFWWCNNLTEVYYAAENPIIGKFNMFSDGVYKNADLYVLEAAIERCKEIEPWKNFKKILSYKFSGIDETAAEANEPVITLSPMTINVSGVDDDCEVSVYTLAGQLIASERGNCSVTVANRGIYIVKVGTRVEKVSVTR